MTKKLGKLIKEVKTLTKKVAGFFTCFLVFNIAIGFAAPPNQLETGEFAAGTLLGDKSNTYYLESKAGDAFTVGVEYLHWRGQKNNVTDVYGKIDLNKSDSDYQSFEDNTIRLQAILGNRNLPNASRKFVGAQISSEVAPDWVAYSSFIAGQGFEELQVGTTYKINPQNNLNINYRTYRYEGTKNDISFGLDFKF
jgi:hypothetical protein